METQVIEALERKDYRQVNRLLKQWQTTEPDSLLLRLYAARLQEKTKRLESAEKNYLALLKRSPNIKVMKQARAGIARIHAQRKAQKSQALSEAKQACGAEKISLLVLEAPKEEQRKAAIANLAQTFSLDAYAARMKIPNQGIRLYRVGPLGELTYFSKSLDRAPTRVVRVEDIQEIQTFQICYFEAITPKPTIVCKSKEGQIGKISFDWKEVNYRLSGQLPIFEQVVDIGSWGRTVHKKRVQDYAQVIDLHLPQRKIMLRLCDHTYQYAEGISLSGTKEINSRIKWNNLLQQVSQFAVFPQCDDFTQFAKGALDFIPLLPVIAPNLDIDRRAPSDWDIAFHLYSSIYYLG